MEGWTCGGMGSRSYVHTSIRPYVHTSIRPYVHTSIRPYVHTSIPPYLQFENKTRISPKNRRRQLALALHSEHLMATMAAAPSIQSVDPDTAWRAVEQRDAAYDGQFVFAVR